MGAQQSSSATATTPLSSSPQTGLAKNVNGWEATVREEETIQAAAMPPDEVPSCMALFDTWAMCFALGPQIRHVYRYGTPNTCKPKLEDFKYCMTLKGLSKEEFREQWIRRRAERAASQRLERSSEDVWQMQRDPIIDPDWVDPTFPSTASST